MNIIRTVNWFLYHR